MSCPIFWSSGVTKANDSDDEKVPTILVLARVTMRIISPSLERPGRGEGVTRATTRSPFMAVASIAPGTNTSFPSGRLLSGMMKP